MSADQPLRRCSSSNIKRNDSRFPLMALIHSRAWVADMGVTLMSGASIFLMGNGNGGLVQGMHRLYPLGD